MNVIATEEASLSPSQVLRVTTSLMWHHWGWEVFKSRLKRPSKVRTRRKRLKFDLFQKCLMQPSTFKDRGLTWSSNTILRNHPDECQKGLESLQNSWSQVVWQAASWGSSQHEIETITKWLVLLSMLKWCKKRNKTTILCKINYDYRQQLRCNLRTHQ